MLFKINSIGYRFHVDRKSFNMLTAKGKYALKALIHLSTLEPGEKAQGLTISRAGNIPKKFLDAILGELREAGVVYTKKGPGGGYMLARAASDIKIGHVVRAIDGPLAPIGCASRSAYEPCADCKSVKACAVRFTMMKVRDAISEVLDRMTIADMVAMSEGGNVTPMLTGRPAVSGRKRR
jgi:Rrf2 family protein